MATLLMLATEWGSAQAFQVVNPVRPAETPRPADSASGLLSSDDVPSQLSPPPGPAGVAGGVPVDANLRPVDPGTPVPATVSATEPKAGPKAEPTAGADAVAGADGAATAQADVGLGATGLDAAADLGMSAFALNSALTDAGVGQGSYSAAPNMTGDLFGMGSAYVFGIDSLPPNEGGPQPIVLAGPGAAMRRVKLSENFSPEVRNRCFMTYNYFNNAAGRLGDVNRWTLGFERILYDDVVSFEVRQPMAATLSSTQLTSAPGDRGYELGDMALIGKAVLHRDQRWIWTAGLGVTAPLADDAKLVENGETVLRIRNQAVHLLPFTAWLYRYDNDNLFQFNSQLDIDVNGNPISGNLFPSGPRDEGRYTDASLVHLDFSYHRILARNRQQAWVRDWIGNAELHYTGSLEDSPVFEGDGFTVTNLARRFNVVNATFSNHLVLRNNWVVTPGISVPLQNGTDRQFNFEATLQLNYLR